MNYAKKGFYLACEQALRGFLATGQEKEGELKTMWCLWNLNSTSNSTVAPCQLSCQISDNQRKAETNTNLNKHWKICAKSNNVITNVIFTNQHFALTILMQIFKFQRWVASSPSFCRPVARAPWRACSQASFFSKVNILIKFFHREVNWKWNNISAFIYNVMYVKQKKEMREIYFFKK